MIERCWPNLVNAGTGRGPIMEPIWKLLKSKSRTDDWNHHHRGGLKSAMAKRQFPQTRMLECGFATHDKCLVCLSRIVDEDERTARGNDTEEVEDGNLARTRSINDKVVASDEQLNRAPKGDLNHRIWKGDCLKTLRERRASQQDLAIVRDVNIRGHAAFEMALMARPPLPRRSGHGS